MAPFEKWFDQDLTKQLVTRHCEGIVLTGDNLSNVIGVRLYKGDAPAVPEGAVTLRAIRADGSTVVDNEGEIEGNAVSILLKEACMAVPGPLVIQLRVTDGDVRTTVLRAVFTVEISETDTIIDPGRIVPDIETLLAMLAEMEDATDAANAAADAAEAAAAEAATATSAANSAATSATNAATAATSATTAANSAASAANAAATDAADAGAQAVADAQAAGAEAVQIATDAAEQAEADVEAAVARTDEVINAAFPTMTAQGVLVRLDGTVDAPMAGMTIYGKSYQDTEPSPQLWDASNMVVLTGDLNGVNVSGTANGAYTIQGTATADRYIYDYDGMYDRTLVLPAGNYTVSASAGLVVDVREYGINIDPDDGTETVVFTNIGYGNPVIFSLTGETHISVNPLVPNGEQISIGNGYVMLVSGTFEKPFQEYTGSDPVPSPTHPRAITNVGDDGSAVVAVENKNLLDVSRLSGGVTLAGVTATASGGVVNFSGTPTGSAYFYGNEMTLPAGTYTISRNALAQNVANQVEIYANDITIPLSAQSYTFRGESGTFTLDHDARIRAGVHVMNFGVSMDGVSISLMLEPGASATEFTPHVDPVETALPLPNAYGLPGIKVSDGGTYSDESGQAWVADTVDFLTHKYTQRIGHIASYAGETIPGAYWSTTGELSTGAEVYYVLTSPIETTLTDAALAAFQRVRTVNGTTVVWVDDALSPVIEAAARMAIKDYMDQLIYVNGHTLVING